MLASILSISVQTTALPAASPCIPCVSLRSPRPLTLKRRGRVPLPSRKGVRGMLAATLPLWRVDGVGVDFALLGKSHVHHCPV